MLYPKLLLAASIGLAPTLLATAIGFDDAIDERLGAAIGQPARVAVAFGCMAIADGLIARLVLDRLSGVRVSLLTALAAAIRRVLPLACLGLLTSLPTTAFTALLWNDVRWIRWSWLVQLAVPCVIILTNVLLAPAAAVIVVERRTTFGAIARSMELTRGCRMKLFVSFMVVALLLQLIRLLLDFAIGSFGKSPALSFHNGSMLVATALRTPLLGCFSAVAYHRLRAAKEGTDLGELKQVFS